MATNCCKYLLMLKRGISGCNISVSVVAISTVMSGCNVSVLCEQECCLMPPIESSSCVVLTLMSDMHLCSGSRGGGGGGFGGGDRVRLICIVLVA